MSSLLKTLIGQLDEGSIRQISAQLGVEDKAAQDAISTALPALIGALERNTSTEEGAQALTRALREDHDGRILDNIPTAVSRPETSSEGEAILRHVLGEKQERVEQGVAQASGVDPQAVGKLLKILAPLVMGLLGSEQTKQNLGPTEVARLLQTERQDVDSELTGLARLFDMDGDGEVTDDLIGLGTSLLGQFFGRK